MRRILLLVPVALFAVVTLLVAPAWAGSPHFVGTPTATQSDGTLSVSAKEAGLGDESQITAVLNATAQCINPGGNHPKAGNKQNVSSNSTVPVQNGKADYTITVTASFQPECSPPMTVKYTNITLTDTTNNLTVHVASP